MALKKHTSTEILRFSSLIREAADALQSIAEGMDAGEMPVLWLNSDNAENKFIPGIRRWARKSKTDFEGELEAFLSGKASPAEANKIRSALNKRYLKSAESEESNTEPEPESPPKKPAKKKKAP